MMLLTLTHGVFYNVSEFFFLDIEHYSYVATNSKNSLGFQNSYSRKCRVMMFLKILKDDFFLY